MARARSRGRSYGGGYTWCPRVSNVYGGMSDDDDGPRLGYVERLMQLPLKERCHEISLHYARHLKDKSMINKQLMGESHFGLAAVAKKKMVGCPEKYFDVDSVAAAYLDNSKSDDDDGRPKLGYVEGLMQLPLEERCHQISIHYARLMGESHFGLAAVAKKKMVGCPEKYFDVDSVTAAYLDNK